VHSAVVIVTPLNSLGIVLAMHPPGGAGEPPMAQRAQCGGYRNTSQFPRYRSCHAPAGQCRRAADTASVLAVLGHFLLQEKAFSAQNDAVSGIVTAVKKGADR